MSKDEILPLLAGIPIFAQMEKDARGKLARALETSSLRVGDVLFHKGEPSDGGYVVANGSIAQIGRAHV